jgi:ATP-binding cassette subfamily F protein 3
VLVHSDANVLILDEPTNHLDIDAREALEDALGAFEGSVLLVSHDRALLDAVGTRTIALEDGVLISHLGGWADYARAKEEAKEAEETAKRGGGTKSRPGATPVAGAKEARAQKAGASKRGAGKADAPKGGSATAGGATAVRGAGSAPGKGNGGRAKNGGGAAKSAKSNNARRRLAALERDVERAEAALKTVEAELAGSDAWSTTERSEESSARHAAAKRAVEEAYSHWEAAAT